MRHPSLTFLLFQSTLPRGERRRQVTPKNIGNIISIHAPTRGATGIRNKFLDGQQNFNPRSHEGSDSWTHLNNTWFGYFNPRSHEGSDFTHLAIGYTPRYFNPRSHEGSDSSNLSLSKIGSYFNPRSHEGSDRTDDGDNLSLLHISIHAPTRGATCNEDICVSFYHISIHAPTRGATQIDRCIDVNLIFQSTLPRGERPIPMTSTGYVRNFNPRSHEGSDL